MHARQRGMDAYQIVDPWEQRRPPRNYHDAEQFGIQVPQPVRKVPATVPWRGHSHKRGTNALNSGLYIGVLIGRTCFCGRRFSFFAREWTSLTWCHCAAMAGAINRESVRVRRRRTARLQPVLLRLKEVIIRLGNAAGENQQNCRGGYQKMCLHSENSTVVAPMHRTHSGSAIFRLCMDFTLKTLTFRGDDQWPTH